MASQDPAAESGTGETAGTAERSVTPLELFFDLVFVFALTEVTALLAQEISLVNYARGLAVLLAVWWAWAGFSWLTNARDAETEWRRLAIVLTMAAMLVVGLAIPTAFGADAMVFAVGYAVVIALYGLTYALSVRDDPEMLRAVRRLSIGLVPTPVLLILAAAIAPSPWGWVLIVLALVIAFASPYLAGVAGWSVSPSHFAERYGLIIIIALGESMVSIGVGATEEAITWQVITGVVLGVFILAAMWWMYFDVVSRVAAQRLSEVTGLARNAMARDSYTYLHLPMVVGIVFLALGLKKALADPGDPLKLLVSLALFGGVALYLFAHVAFRWRNIRSINRQRLVVGLVLLAIVPLGTVMPALLSVAVLALIANALVVFEVQHFKEWRAVVRASE